MKRTVMVLGCLLLAGCAGGAGGGWAVALFTAVTLLVGCHAQSSGRGPAPDTDPAEQQTPATPLADDSPSATPRTETAEPAPAEVVEVDSPAADAPTALNPVDPEPERWDGQRFDAAARLTEGTVLREYPKQGEPFRPTSRAGIRYTEPDARVQSYLDARYGPEPKTRAEVEARIGELEQAIAEHPPYSRIGPIYEEQELERMRQRLQRAPQPKVTE